MGIHLPGEFKKLRFLGVGCHDGNMINGPGPVLAKLAEMGHDVTVYLQSGQTAAASYRSGGTLAGILGGVNVRCLPKMPECGALCGLHAVITAMSPLDGYSLEAEVAGAAFGYDGNIKRPVFGVEDTIGGRNNGRWRDLRGQLTALYAPVADHQNSGCKEVVVGPLALNRWRHVDVDSVASAARQTLAIGIEQPVLYFSPSPEEEGADGFVHLAGLIKTEIGKKLPRNMVFLLNRHRRELVNRVPGRGRKYQWGLRVLEQAGVKVFDNSPEYDSLSLDDELAICPECRPERFLTYQEMLAVTLSGGVAMSFFGTDVLMVAPHLPGLAPLLWLDPRFGGGVLGREKGIDRFDALPVVAQKVDDAGLMSWLSKHFGLTPDRNAYCSQLQRAFPFPETSSVDAIVSDIIRRVQPPAESK